MAKPSRLVALEVKILGQGQTGGVVPRVASLETALFGGPRRGGIFQRVSALEAAVDQTNKQMDNDVLRVAQVTPLALPPVVCSASIPRIAPCAVCSEGCGSSTLN